MQQEQLHAMVFFSENNFAFQADGGKYLRRRRGKKTWFCVSVMLEDTPGSGGFAFVCFTG